MTLMLLLALSAMHGPTEPAHEDVYYINGKSFDCLIRNAGALARSPWELIEIDLRSCPQPRITEGPIDNWPTLSPNPPSRLDFAVLLTRQEAHCVWLNRARPQYLRRAAGRDRYRLIFPCRS